MVIVFQKTFDNNCNYSRNGTINNLIGLNNNVSHEEPISPDIVSYTDIETISINY